MVFFTTFITRLIIGNGSINLALRFCQRVALMRGFALFIFKAVSAARVAKHVKQRFTVAACQFLWNRYEQLVSLCLSLYVAGGSSAILQCINQTTQFI